MDNEERKNKKINTIVTIIAVFIVAVIFIWREFLKFEVLDPELVISYNEKFEMQLTKGWESVTQGSLNSEADIEIRYKAKEMYLVALMEDITEYDATFQDYVDVTVEGIEEAYNVTISEVNTDGKNKYFDFEFSQDGTEVYMCIYIVQTENYVGQVAIWSLAENRDEVITQIENGIVESIKER